MKSSESQGTLEIPTVSGVEPGFNHAKSVPRAHLTPWPEQPRQEILKEDQEELRASMKEHGFDEAYPILARPLEYQVLPGGKGFDFQYRAHASSEWRAVWDEIELPESPSWSRLETQDDVEQALAWLPKYQIVDGERRWTEAGKLNIHELPVVIREMTDSQALEKALISALQKKSLNVLEQAEAFGRLIDYGSSSTKSIAARLGISERTVSDVLDLRVLRGTTAGKLLTSGAIGVRHGRVIGRLPTEELREEWANKVMSNPWGPSPMPIRQLEDKLKECVMKELRNLAFDTTDETLVPLVKDEASGRRLMGGDCTSCPYNTRNMLEMEGAKGTHMCMLPTCLRAKQEAAHERWRGEVKPHGTLSIEENDALWAPSGEALAFSSSFVELDEKPHDLDLKPTAVCDKTWRKLVKGRDVQTIAARDAKGKTHLLLKKEVAIAAAVENKHHIFRKEPEVATPAATAAPEAGAIPAVEAAAATIKNESADAATRAAEEEAEEEKECVWEARNTALADAITGAKHTPDGFFALLLEEFGDYFDDGRSLAAQRRGVPGEAITKSAVKGNDMSFAALFIEVYLHEMWWSNGSEVGDVALKSFAKLFGVDLKQPEKAAKKALAERRDQAAAAAEVTEGMVWKDDPGEARVSSANLVENPHRCDLVFPKALKITANISVAQVGGEWLSGFFIQGPKFGTSEQCSTNGVKYGNRALAVRAGLLAIEGQVKAANVPAPMDRVSAWITEATGSDADAMTRNKEKIVKAVSAAKKGGAK